MSVRGSVRLIHRLAGPCSTGRQVHAQFARAVLAGERFARLCMACWIDDQWVNHLDERKRGGQTKLNDYVRKGKLVRT